MARGQLHIDSKDRAAADGGLIDAFAALGLECEPDLVIDEDEFWLWPENEEVFWLWSGLQTQWVVSMAGAVGLNYGGVEADLRLLGIPNQKRRQIYILIKHMEQATLEEWASKR